MTKIEALKGLFSGITEDEIQEFLNDKKELSEVIEYAEELAEQARQAMESYLKAAEVLKS